MNGVAITGRRDNKALNRSVLRRQGRLVVGWSWPPIVSDSSFTNLNFSSARLTRALSTLGKSDLMTNNAKPKSTMQRFSIADIFVLTAICSIPVAFLAHASRYNFSPIQFARTLEYNMAAGFMVACTIGLFVFTSLFVTASILFVRKTNFALRIFFASSMILYAVASVPIMYSVAAACAGAIGG